jgi:hypothetical protein
MHKYTAKHDLHSYEEDEQDVIIQDIRYFTIHHKHFLKNIKSILRQLHQFDIKKREHYLDFFSKDQLHAVQDLEEYLVLFR